jgi:hypothetical protein
MPLRVPWKVGILDDTDLCLLAIARECELIGVCVRIMVGVIVGVGVDVTVGVGANINMDAAGSEQQRSDDGRDRHFTLEKTHFSHFRSSSYHVGRTP